MCYNAKNTDYKRKNGECFYYQYAEVDNFIRLTKCFREPE